MAARVVDGVGVGVVVREYVDVDGWVGTGGCGALSDGAGLLVLLVLLGLLRDDDEDEDEDGKARDDATRERL
jgi:hypothetical protein